MVFGLAINKNVCQCESLECVGHILEVIRGRFCLFSLKHGHHGVKTTSFATDVIAAILDDH